MASITQDKPESGKAAKAPISTHAAFPFVVALWFAALLGIGSLVVPVAVIEQISTTTGLSSIVPAAAPPLGFTARALIALVFTVIGAGAGLLIARQVAKAHGAEKTPKRERMVGRKPIDAHAELGGEGLGSPVRGRRALAISDDGGPSEFFDLAPLPGVVSREGDVTLADAAEEASASDVPEDGLEEADMPLDLAELDLAEFGEDEEDAAELEDEAEESAEFTGHQDFVPSEEKTPIEDEIMSDRQDFILGNEVQDEPAEELAEELSNDTEDDAAFASAWVEDEGNDEDGGLEVEAEEAPQSFVPDVTDEPADESAEDVSAEVETAQPARWQESRLDEIGLVQLAQRLGASIEKHREFRSARAAALASAAKPAGKPLAEDFEVAEAEEAAAAMASFFGSSADQTQVEDEAEEIFEPTDIESSEESVAEEVEEDDVDFALARPFDAPSGEAEVTEEEISPFVAFNTAETDESEMEAEQAVKTPAAPARTATVAAKPARGTLFERMANLSRGVEVVEEKEPDEEAQAPAVPDFSRPAPVKAEKVEAVAEEEEEAVVEDDERQVFQAGPAEDKRAYKPFEGFADIDLDEDEDEIDDLAASFSLPLQRMRAESAPIAAEAASEAEVEEVAEPEADEDFETPQVMGNPFKQRAEEFIRIEDEPADESGHVEPAVIFPNEEKGDARPAAKPARIDSTRPSAKFDPEENERALREALLNLQRMSGAA